MPNKLTVTASFSALAFLEICLLCYYGYEEKISHPKIYNNSAWEDRIVDDIEGELMAIYGEEGHRAQAKKSRPDGADEDKIEANAADRFALRKEHLTKVCNKYHRSGIFFNRRRKTSEFLINKKHNLIWCNIFKAASSTWLWNFNLLGGYSERQLVLGADGILSMARKIYPRPNAHELDEAQSNKSATITFIISRHPFTRLISGFRDKILKGIKYYRPIAKMMMRNHPELQEQHPEDWHSFLPIKSMTMPTFAQFAQYIIDERNSGRKLNEHWIPMNDYCTPCQNDFNVIAKVETLAEDNNYIIHKSDIGNIVQPRVINKAIGSPSEAMNDYFICQLKKKQLENLIEIYKYDFELFDYSVERYRDCVKR